MESSAHSEHNESSSSKPPKTKQIAIIIISLVFDLLAFTSILPLFPIIIDFYAKEPHRDTLYDLFETSTRTFQDAIGVPYFKRYNSVLFGGLLGSLFSALQFLSSPVLGALSDVYGRKPILIVSLCGSLCSYLLWYNASKFSIFVLSRVIGGISKASTSIYTAIISDLYSEQNVVGKGMALLGGAFSIGFIIGPMFGAYFSYSSRIISDNSIDIINNTDNNHINDLFYNIPAKFAILLTLIEMIIIYCKMRETHDRSKRKSTLKDVLNNCSLYVNPRALFNFSAIAKTIPAHELNKIKAYGRAYFVYLFIYSGLEFTLSFFTHLRFQYDSMQQGRMYLIAGIIMMLLQGGFVRRIAASHHHNAVLIAISILIPAFVCIAFAYTQHLFYCGLVLFAIASAIVIPCMTSCVTNLSSTSARGATIGVFRCIGALARAIGPLFASTVFWIGGPSICYVLGGCALIVPMLMIKRVKHAKTS